MRAAGGPTLLLVAGALPQRFLGRSRAPGAPRGRAAESRRRPIPTRLFLSDRGVEHYARAGIELRVLRPIELLALTVNPVAPQSHSFDSAALRRQLAEAIPDLPVFDVLHPSYTAARRRCRALRRATACTAAHRPQRSLPRACAAGRAESAAGAGVEPSSRGAPARRAWRSRARQAKMPRNALIRAARRRARGPRRPVRARGAPPATEIALALGRRTAM